MDESFTIQISSNLVNRLVNDGEKLKKKTKKLKAKIPRDIKRSPAEVQIKEISKDLEARKDIASEGWPVQPPLFLPVPPLPPTHSATAELDVIRSVLQESEKVVERLQKHEEDMVREVTQKAKNLHDEEFKLPSQKPMPCSNEIGACLDCYKEYASKDPLKCSPLVMIFADCSRRARQQIVSPAMQPS